jgi:cytochrome c1
MHCGMFCRLFAHRLAASAGAALAEAGSRRRANAAHRRGAVPAAPGPCAMTASASAMALAPVWKTVLVTLAALAALGAAAGTVVLLGGVYDVSALRPHTRPMYFLLEEAMNHAVRRRAADIVPPPGFDGEASVARGALCFRDKCQSCHGGPGVSAGEAALGMQPLPGSLIDATRRRSPAELYWIARHGIKMSGMPAWQYRMSDDDLWSVVAFMTRLPDMTPTAYRERVDALGAAECRSAPSPAPPPGEDARTRAERGRLAMQQHGCTACHTIPGVSGSPLHVGPPLAGFGRRPWIAGRLANTPDNLAAWIRDPQAIDPRTAMPNAGVGAQAARDMAAYLGSLR